MRVEATKSVKTITFEQPLNEYYRLCLRVEQLFNEIDDHINIPQCTSSQIALNAVAKIIDLINRPDIKSKISQLLTQQATTLSQLEQAPQVDKSRLKLTLEDMERLISSLHYSRQRIAERLLSNEFLSQLRLQMGNPGGVTVDKMPAYFAWLCRSADLRTADLKTWVAEFDELQQIVRLILKLSRESAQPQTISCEEGYYHQTLDPALPCQMLRLTLPLELGIYPEISVGKHRFNIRFLIPNYHDQGRPTQVKSTIQFDLSCCRL